jgi:hypothetical protein
LSGEKARPEAVTIWNTAEHRVCHQKIIVRQDVAGVGAGLAATYKTELTDKGLLLEDLCVALLPKLARLALA